jgi:hypothetical protein
VSGAAYASAMGASRGTNGMARFKEEDATPAVLGGPSICEPSLPAIAGTVC